MLRASLQKIHLEISDIEFPAINFFARYLLLSLSASVKKHVSKETWLKTWLNTHLILVIMLQVLIYEVSFFCLKRFSLLTIFWLGHQWNSPLNKSLDFKRMTENFVNESERNILSILKNWGHFFDALTYISTTFFPQQTFYNFVLSCFIILLCPAFRASIFCEFALNSGFLSVVSNVP